MVNQAYWSWINGDFTIDSTISTAGGLTQHGYGVFETCYVEGLSIRYWNAHFARLIKACETYFLQLPLSSCELKKIALELMHRNQLTSARLKVSIGAANLDYYSGGVLQSDLIVSILPYTRPIAVAALEPVDATKVGCILSRFKTVNYMGYIRAKQEALSKGATDALLIDPEGNVIESSTANIFLKCNNKWLTPSLERYGLAGIQRAYVLRVMEEFGYEVEQTDILIDSHKLWEEAFVCNSLVGVQQVEKIRGLPLSLNSPDFTRIRKRVRSVETLEV